MARLHIIGIGGTGHKLINACVYLTASGAFKGKMGSSQINSIRILDIDADASNGNLHETQDLVSAYEKFYKAVGASEALGLVEIEPLQQIRLYHDEKKSISKTFNISQYKGKDTDRLVNFLYTRQEIETEFDQGFYGHTSIGTLIVKDILGKDPVWADFLSGISGSDFVFVVGSIFGGTGASAIPVVLDTLKQIKDGNGNIKYSVLLLAPYFKTVGRDANDGELQPDSDNFQVKAKAALYYYNKQNKFHDVDAIYIIGEPKENFSNEAKYRGSSEQRNKAHPIELFGASAIIDFIKESDKRTDKKVITADRDSKNGEFYWTWGMVQNIDWKLPDKIKKLTKLSILFNKILYGELKSEKAVGLWKNNYDKAISAEKDDSGNFLYENIRKFTEKFVSWVFDLHKKNSDEVDQASPDGRLKWAPDERMRLFNAAYVELFDNRIILGAKIENFANLVYNDENPKDAEKIYADLCEKTPKTGGTKRFAALFDTLVEIIEKPAFSLFKKKPVLEKYDLTVPYLSREGNTTFVKQAASEGQLWSKSEAKLLLDIANGLPFTLNSDFSADDISIPSPWSIFIATELTLTEKSFEKLNRTAYNQWCGLIALLVLKKLRLYESRGLSLVPLNIDAVGEFVITAANTCLPYSHIFNNPRWTDCYAFSLDGETIAMLAHNTIVCPAYSLSAAAKNKLNKLEPSIVSKKGEFLTPQNYFADQNVEINRNAKHALALFLNELKEIITEQAAGNAKPIVTSMQKLVEQYIADLGRTVPNENISLSRDDGDIRSVGDLFEKRSINSQGEHKTPFLLIGTNKKAVLIGTEIGNIKSSSDQAATIHITDKILFSDIDEEAATQKNGTVEEGILLLYDKALLLDTMTVIKKEGAPAFGKIRTNKTSLQEYEVIWPISEILAGLFDPEKLNTMLSVKKNGEAISVSLGLKLDGGKTHTVRKEYRITANQSDNDTAGKCFFFERRQLPFWAVWPYCEILDFKGNNTWKRYNFFCVEIKQRGALKIFEAEPCFAGKPPAKDESNLSTISDPQRDKYYKRFTALPNALKFSVKDDADRPSVYCGIIFLEPPPQYPAKDGVWNIGLDFGTTSTTAFFAKNGGDSTPEFIQLLSEYKWKTGNHLETTRELPIDMAVLCNSGDVGEDNFKLYFIDDKCLEQNSYLTTYEVMDMRNQLRNDTIFETGRIFWHNYDNFKVMNSTENRRDNLRTNIKWDADTSFVGKYLNQLMTQITYTAVTNGVRKINWYFSYPTAMSMSARDEFGGRLESIIKSISNETGVEIKFKSGSNMVTESIAAAYYFKRQNEKKQIFLCVDIGGGTSDISVWDRGKNKNLFQTSIRFASRDMFISPLERLLEVQTVLKNVRKDQPEDGIHTMLEYGGPGTVISKDKIKFFIETVLFEYYEEFRKRLTEKENEEYFKKFKYSVFIAYSGLMYYLGNIIIALLQSGDDGKKIDTTTAEVVLGLSGKGSKLTTWLDSFCKIIYKGVEKRILEQTGVTLRLSVNFDDKYAKTETAKGLISNLDAAGRQKEETVLANPEVFMGSGVRLIKDNRPKFYAKDSFVSHYKDEYIEDTNGLTAEFPQDMDDFTEFLEFFNQLAGETEGSMKKIDMRWYGEHKNILWNQVKTEFGNILTGQKRFDPPFIVSLRVFLDFYNEEYLYEKK